MNKILFDVSKGNNIFLFALSVPFIILTIILMLFMASLGGIAMMIGRRPAFHIIYEALVKIGIINE